MGNCIQSKKQQNNPQVEEKSRSQSTLSPSQVNKKSAQNLETKLVEIKNQSKNQHQSHPIKNNQNLENISTDNKNINNAALPQNKSRKSKQLSNIHFNRLSLTEIIEKNQNSMIQAYLTGKNQYQNIRNKNIYQFIHNNYIINNEIELQFTKQQLQDPSLNNLIDGFRNMPHNICSFKINLEGLDLNIEQIQCIQKGIYILPKNIQQLELDYWSIIQGDFDKQKYLPKLISNLPSELKVLEINLGKNLIGQMSTTIVNNIAEALKQLPKKIKIFKLNLSNNILSQYNGIRLLIDALKYLPDSIQILDLNLDYNNIDSQCADIITQFLSNLPKKLQVLNLYLEGSKIGKLGSEKIINCTSKFPESIQYFNINPGFDVMHYKQVIDQEQEKHGRSIFNFDFRCYDKPIDNDQALVTES